MFVQNKRAKATSRDRSLGKLNCNEKSSVAKLAVCTQEADSKSEFYRRGFNFQHLFLSLRAIEDEKLRGASEERYLRLPATIQAINVLR